MTRTGPAHLAETSTEAPALVERLRSVPDLRDLPSEELEWLATHGRLAVFEPGVMYRPGDDARDLIIILSGRIAVRMDRGLGPRQVMEWAAGDVTGRLPFSRMGRAESTILTDVRTETFALDLTHFPELIHKCPAFTALTVHNMIDRTRGFRTSDLQDEKMMSLGRLAAGLAHELNNPASATMRGAKQLRASLSDVERTARGLSRAGLSEDRIASIARICSQWPGTSASSELLDRELEIAGWLMTRQLGPDSAQPLADTGVTLGQLDELADIVPSEAMGAVVDWLVADRTTREAAADIERAAKRIYDVVAAMKRFTDLDRVSGPEPVDVEAGLRDTITVLRPRGATKGATITLEAQPDVPAVQAVGSELNQVWTNLIENAIDAVGESGHIRVKLGRESDHVVVRVVDDGPGIDPEIISRIFDPFFTTKLPGQGVGLGLEIVRQLLRRYGGEIGVRSEPGRTEFTVRLRVHAPVEASSAASKSDVAP